MDIGTGLCFQYVVFKFKYKHKVVTVNSQSVTY
jgi:hypothetical protein